MKHTFKKMLSKLLVTTAVVALATISASACTTIYTGGNLMQEGTPFVARTEDYGSHMNKLWMISEAGEFKEGELFLGCPGYGEFEWTWTHDSYRFTHFTNDVFPVCPECGQSDPKTGFSHYSYTEFGTNEKGLSVSATETIYGNKQVTAVDPFVQDKVDGIVGIEETDIPTILLAEAGSAREAVELLCNIYDEYGAFFASGVFVCDQNETWYIENCSGHQYVAIKLNDDIVFLEPNIAVIGRVDLDDENIIASADLIKVAKEAGTFVGDEAENVIDFRASYAPLDRVGAPRMVDGLNYLDASLNCTEEDLLADNTMFTISNLKDDQIVPMYTNINVDRKLDKNDVFGYYKLSSIGKASNQEIEIFQLFKDRPVETATVGWVGVGDMSNNAFVPYYPMLLTDVYDGYQVSTDPVIKHSERPVDADFDFSYSYHWRHGAQYIQYPANWRESFYFTFEYLGSYIQYADKIDGVPVKAADKQYVLDQVWALQNEMNAKFEAMDPKDTTKVGMEMAEKLHKLGLEMIDYLRAQAWKTPFVDVKEDAWYNNSIAYIFANEYMNGYSATLFGPTDTMTRAQVAQTLYNFEGAPAVAAKKTFIDVPAGQWFTDAVNWAADAGIVKGYGNGYFGVNDGITREDLAVMLYHAAGSPEVKDEQLAFEDVDDISTYAVTAMKWAVQNGIMSGTPAKTLLPQAYASRAEFAQMFMQYDLL